MTALYSTIYNDARLLGRFLRHYADAGIAEFLIAHPPKFTAEVSRFTERFPITSIERPDMIDALLAGSAVVTEMRRRHQHDREWVVIADLDEFVDWPEPIDDIVATAERENANVVRGIMYDCFSRDGRPAEFSDEADLTKVYPIKSRFINEVMRGCDHKGVLVRGHALPVSGAGHHLFQNERLCSKLLEISHYKWIPGAVDRLRASYHKVVEAGLPWADEYRRALEHFDSHGGFAWETFGGRPSEEFRPVIPARCAACPAPLSEAEYDFSMRQFGKPLCRTDQKTAQPVAV